MYGKEDRERILADLRASGLTVASFARLPGSPSRQSLSSWRRQAEAGLLDVPERKVRGRCEHGRHGRYPEATKREAVSLRRKGMGFADIARRLGVSSGSVVASWWRKAGEGGTMAPKEAVPMDPGRKAAGATREELEAMLAEAQMENAVLRELMRDPKAGDPASLSNRRKAELGERLRRDCGYSLKEITAFLRMPKSTYEYNRRRNAGEVDGRPANLPLREDGTHDFGASRPGELVVTDVTEFKAGGRKVYLSPIIDCFDGMPVSWSVSERPDSALCDSSLLPFLSTLPEGHPPVTAHSDGGCQYRARSWKRICGENGVVRSMSRKGCCPDNARAEGFFGILKEEFYNGRGWSAVPPGKFAEMLDDFLRWYRDGRLKAFREGGRLVYDTISGRRRRLGYAA